MILKVQELSINNNHQGSSHQLLVAQKSIIKNQVPNKSFKKLILNSVVQEKMNWIVIKYMKKNNSISYDLSGEKRLTIKQKKRYSTRYNSGMNSKDNMNNIYDDD